MTARLAHTTDVAIWAEGYSLQELFRAALREMNEVLLPGSCTGVTHYDCNMRIRLQAADATALLIDFLSEALALTYIQKAIFCYVYFERLTEREVAANLYGAWFGEVENEIKAVTWHEARVQQVEGKWQTPVLFDL
ncbi:archease [Robiginitalea marina]|uniref:Archease n=1 Tax=Robiginitalea marina TaxID=2954105 RepID=A0ABT1ATK2_9FLAO|nr:archease [Robiginitalea marina]MCO5723265.1 archease [Robiginitalea marina]